MKGQVAKQMGTDIFRNDRPSLRDPILGPAIFDRRLRLFRQLSTYSDGRIVVKDATRVAPKELIHRVADSGGKTREAAI